MEIYTCNPSIWKGFCEFEANLSALVTQWARQLTGGRVYLGEHFQRDKSSSPSQQENMPAGRNSRRAPRPGATSRKQNELGMAHHFWSLRACPKWRISSNNTTPPKLTQTVPHTEDKVQMLKAMRFMSFKRMILTCIANSRTARNAYQGSVSKNKNESKQVLKKEYTEKVHFCPSVPLTFLIAIIIHIFLLIFCVFGSSGRAASVLNHYAISPAPWHSSLGVPLDIAVIIPCPTHQVFHLFIYWLYTFPFSILQLNCPPRKWHLYCFQLYTKYRNIRMFSK